MERPIQQSRRTSHRDYWVKRARWTLDAAESLLNITKTVFGEPLLNYVKYYVAITVGGYNYRWLHKRSQGKSLLGFRMAQSLQDEAAGLLDVQNITYIRKPKKFLVTVDAQMIEQNSEAFVAIATLVKKSWEAGG